MSSNRLVARAQARDLQFQILSNRGAVNGGQSSDPRQASRPSDEAVAAIERDAFQKGFEAGRNSGLEMAEKKVEAIMGRFAEALVRLGQTRDEIVRVTQRDLVRLAVEVARKLIQREVQIDPEIVVTLVRVAIDRTSDRSPITVYLNPDDLQYIEARIREVPELLGERELVLKPKRELRRGDCQVESPYGNVDASITEQFRQIENGLLAQF